MRSGDRLGDVKMSKKGTLLHRISVFNESPQTQTVFADWKKKGWSTIFCLRFFFKFLPQDLRNYDLSKFSDSFTRFFFFFQIWETTGQKYKKIWDNLVAMSMLNKCAKFHGDFEVVKKLSSISRARLNISIIWRQPILCSTLYRNPVQASNFGGTFDQLFLWIFFFAVFTDYASLFLLYHGAKKVKMTKKTQIRGSCFKPPLLATTCSQRLCFFMHGQFNIENARWVVTTRVVNQRLGFSCTVGCAEWSRNGLHSCF